MKLQQGWQSRAGAARAEEALNGGGGRERELARAQGTRGDGTSSLHPPHAWTRRQRVQAAFTNVLTRAHSTRWATRTSVARGAGWLPRHTRAARHSSEQTACRRCAVEPVGVGAEFSDLYLPTSTRISPSLQRTHLILVLRNTDNREYYGISFGDAPPPPPPPPPHLLMTQQQPPARPPHAPASGGP
jgi:hypothetical protein